MEGGGWKEEDGRGEWKERMEGGGGRGGGKEGVERGGRKGGDGRGGMEGRGCERWEEMEKIEIELHIHTVIVLHA
jgi:hypothetical protein